MSKNKNSKPGGLTPPEATISAARLSLYGVIAVAIIGAIVTMFSPVVQNKLMGPRKEEPKKEEMKAAPPRADTDEVTILNGVLEMKSTGTQYFVHGRVRVAYFGKGPYQTQTFVACINEPAGYCVDNSDFGLSKNHGEYEYDYSVSMPGGKDWKDDRTQVNIKVCLISTKDYWFFSAKDEDRYSHPVPICGFYDVKF